MSVIAELVRSWRKSKEVLRLEAVIDSSDAFVGWVSGEISGDAYSRRSEASERAFEEFLDLCEGDPNVRIVMRQFNADRETLRELYRALIEGGAGQWIKGHFVAASALAYAPTLEFCLREKANGDLSKDEIAFAMMRYFRGSPLKRPSA